MDLLDQIRANIRAALDQRAAHQATIDETLGAAEARGDGNLTDDETARFTEARDAIAAVDADIEAMEAREAEIVATREARAAAEARANRLGAPVAPADVRNVREPDLYRAGGDHSFLSDAFRSQVLGDHRAAERIARHNAFEAERRDANVANFGALIPPVYLVDQFAAIARAGRPFSNSITRLELPPQGTSFNIPRGTTGTTTAVQSSEGDALSETDFDETTLAASLRTIGGAQDISRQAIERGTVSDEVIYADLASAYAVSLNAANITSLLAVSGIEAVTYTDASPTVAEFWPKLADAVQRVNANRFLPATAIYMHPRRWGWLTSALDSTGRPTVQVGPAPMNPLGVGDAAAYGQVVGQLLGLPVITDSSIPTNLGTGTNEDIVIVGRAPDYLLWEENGGVPNELRFEQPQGKKLVVEVAVYGYSVFTAGRYPKATATIGGTGLVTPSF